MLCAFFQLLIYCSLANQDSRHFYPIDKRIDDRIQRKLNSNIKFKETSNEISCPSFDKDIFKEIVDGTSTDGNYYACNQRFKTPISIKGQLQIYHCKFINFKSKYDPQPIPISINSVSEGKICISDCDFFICSCCINLNQVNTNELKITNCRFARCSSQYSSAIIQFNSNSGTIENCYFFNNYGSSSDIHYNPSSTDLGLTITNCVYQVALSSYGATGSSPTFLKLKDGSKITFKNNDFYMWTKAKIFASQIKNLGDQTFENINMYPYEDEYIGSTLPDGFTIGNGESMDCTPDLPEGMPSVQPNFYCGNIGTQTDSTLIQSYNFLQVYYSSFEKFKNVNGNGGAAYLSIPNQPNIDAAHAIKFYHSVFVECSAQNGCAIYLESADQNRLFDFYKCTFDGNRQSEIGKKTEAGGAIYIKSSVSSFKFSDCVFSFNYAKDGGAIYFLSDESDTSTDKTSLLMQISGCYFCNNQMYNTGGALSINIKNNQSPRPIEINSCTFVENVFTDDDTSSDKPEYGGAIYYSYESSDASGTDSYYLHVFDCIFMHNKATVFGGAICLLINGPDKLIEIERCSFDVNAAYFDSDFSGKGGAVYYFLNQASQTDNSNPSLNIHDCNFTNCIALDQGASISVAIQNAQSLRPIEINNCLFDDSDISTTLGSLNIGYPICKNGVFLSYAIDSSSDSPSNNNPPLHITECKFEQIFDRFKLDNSQNERGGCICLLINNCQQTGGIVIDRCKFSHKRSSAKESYGGSIYYISNVATESEAVNQVLSISNSEFSESEVLNKGGSIYIEFVEDNSQKEITLTNCSFSKTTSTNSNDAIYIKSNKNTHDVKFNDCTFDSCMILFDALSTSIESCRFNEIGIDKHAICYASESTEFSEGSFKIDKCNFTQTSTAVGSLVYFNTQLSSKFIFTFNDIKFTDVTSRVFDCTAGIKIEEGEKFWEFHNNTLDPNDEAVIKTDNAKDIPAFCVTGFSCVPVPKNCDDNNRCDLTGENGQFPLQVLNDKYYDGLSTEGTNVKHGGAIRLINYQLECKNSHFIRCKAEEGGGGGVFIVVQNAPTEQKSFVFEKCTFKECVAKFGGGMYIYSNQQDCEFQISRCTFDTNKADLSSADNNHLFGGSAVYLQSQKCKLLRCSFKKNKGNGVKIYQIDDIDPPSSNSLSISSDSESSMIQISECFFESDKFSSSSSLFYADNNSRNSAHLNVIGCTFVGELPKGAFHIDGESAKGGKLNLMIEKCMFASDRKIALNSKLNVMSFDLKSQRFNYKKNEHSTCDFNLVAFLAIVASAIFVVALAIIIVIKKRNGSQIAISDNDENAIEQIKAEI